MVFPQCQSPRYTSTLTKEGARGGRKGRPKQKSEYGTQFQEKQKSKFTYGVTERQFVNYVNAARSSKKGNPANMLCQSLETRLDNVIYRLGIATSRSFARQIVSHGHILVNGRRLNTPSYSVKVGDKVSIRKVSQKSPLFADLKGKLKDFKFPKWLKFDLDNLEAEVVYLPELADGDQTLNLNVVVEFYSRT